jgi:hypothetical protein
MFHGFLMFAVHFATTLREEICAFYQSGRGDPIDPIDPVEAYTWLVAQGIPVNQRNCWGETALWRVSKQREVDALLALGLDRNIVDCQGRTAPILHKIVPSIP